MSESTVLFPDFQISIPKAVRDAQRWGVGQKLALIPKNGGVLVVAVPSREELWGSMKGANPEGFRDRADRI